MSKDPDWVDAKVRKRPKISTKRLRVILGLVAVIVIAFGGQMLFKAYKSRQQQDWGLGLQDGVLKPCGSKPNCVSSVNDPMDKDHHISPITAPTPEALEEVWDQLQSALKALNFEIQTNENNYLHATDTTSLLRFVDDVEFQKIPEENSIQVKSKSRVGFSDMGANRKRLKKILKQISSTSL